VTPHTGSLLVDRSGRTLAVTDVAKVLLGIDEYRMVLFEELFIETQLASRIAAGDLGVCCATVKANAAKLHLHAELMNSLNGSIVHITLSTVRQEQRGMEASSQTTEIDSPFVSAAGLDETPLEATPATTHLDLADYSPHGLLLLSSDFGFLDANTAFFDMTHLPRDEVLGRGWLAALPIEESQELAGALTDVDWENSERIERECRLVSPLGDLLWVRLFGQRIVANKAEGKDALYNYVLTFDDIDQRKQSDDINQRLAHYDSLTGLPNRRDFEKVLTDCILERATMRSILAVLFIDLDGFKQVNDVYGHDVGDQLLKKMATTICDASSRAKRVARLGGDEFTVLLTDVKRIEEVKHFASRLNILLQDNLSIKGVETTVSASIGIAMHHKLIEDRRSADRIVNDLLRHADEAMYAAKSAGKNCYMFYGNYAKEATISRSLQSTANLIREVYRAIQQDELFVEYQPQVTTSSGTITSCEALIRWNHHREGLIGPAAFMPLIESNGSMTELTIWLIRRICRDIRNSFSSYSRICGINSNLSISVNLSPAQLQDQEILDAIDQIVTSESLPTERFLFEITERTLIADPAAGHSGIDWLRQRGYGVALDDFGTGYSSLAYLHRFPLDEIKLDGSFISSIETSSASKTVIKSVVELAHALGIRVTAEGVEHNTQLRYLADVGCDQWQGYLMSPALAPNEFMKLIRGNECRDKRSVSAITKKTRVRENNSAYNNAGDTSINKDNILNKESCARTYEGIHTD